MPGSKIDGATFRLDDGKPVIGMALRLNRIDNFWFVLRHEIEHVLREGGKAEAGVLVDSDLGNATEGVPQCEIRVNEAGADFCVPPGQTEDFIARVQPYFSEKKVMLSLSSNTG